jgi:hypothetical protein
MIAVGLVTCERPRYTLRTLASFLRYHSRSAFCLLHADDASQTSVNALLAQAAGFQTIYTAPHRAGPLPALQALVAAAGRAGASHFCYLENDWEWVGPMPQGLHVECVRFYGATKARSGPRAPTGTRRLGTSEQIQWSPCGQGWEYGQAHWGGPPSLTLLPLLAPVVAQAQTFKQVSLLLPTLATLRPVTNLVWHIGEEPTPRK